MAGGGYPAAYRNASRPLARPSLPLSSNAANAARVPGSFPGLKPGNTNVPLPSLIGRALPIAGRLLPLIGYGLLLYELWKFWNEFQSFQRTLGLPGGWIVTSDCGRREDFFNITVAPGSCASGQAQYPWPTTGRSEVASWQDNGPHPFGAPYRNSANAKTYRRVSGTEDFRDPNELVPGILPAPDALPLPAVIPQVLPEAAPSPGTPVPDPSPVPVDFAPYMPVYSPVGDPIRGPAVRPGPRPSRAPYRRRKRGPIFIPFPDIEIIGDTPDELPEPSPSDPRPAPGTGDTPLPFPDAGPRPDLVPGTRIEFLPDEQPEPEPMRHRLRVPPSRTKERKIILTLDGRSVVARGLNVATEYCDVVEAIYQALPEKIRRAVERESSADTRTKETPWWFTVRDPEGRGKFDPQRQGVSCQNKAAAVGAYFDEVDMNKAIDNLIHNEIIDVVLGRLGKAAGEVGRAIGAPVGLGTGPAL